MLVPIVFMPGPCRKETFPPNEVAVSLLHSTESAKWLTSLVCCVLFCLKNAAVFTFAIIYCSVASNNLKKKTSKNCYCFLYHSCLRVSLVAMCVPLFAEHCPSLLCCVVVSLCDCVPSACLLRPNSTHIWRLGRSPSSLKVWTRV